MLKERRVSGKKMAGQSLVTHHRTMTPLAVADPMLPGV
jgi:hypothetical protein